MPGEGLPQPGGGQRSQTKFIVFENFEKMNSQSARVGLSEKELSFLLNLQIIGPNRLQTVPAPGVSVGTLGANAKTAFYASIQGVDYIIYFTTDGAGWLYNFTTATVGQWAPSGTFSNPDATTWQASRLLINDPTAGYSTWDGTLFVRQGGVSPNITVTNGGSGYTTAPTVTISGGSGTGATAVAVIANGVVVAVTLTNPGKGYQAGDTLSVAFGTGTGSGATGTVAMTGAPVVALQLINGGSFTTPTAGNSTLTFSGGGGTGAAGYAVVAASGGSFTVTSIVLTSPGSGYTSAPSVTLSVTGNNARPPSITSSIGTQSVASITRTAGGSGYAAPPAVSIVPSDGVGSGATAVATISGGAVNSLALTATQLNTLLIAVQGVSTSPAGTYNLSFSGGGGSGAVGTVQIGNYTNNSGGTSVGVISFNLTNVGSNYTSAPSVSVSGASFSTSPTILAFIVSQGSGYDLTPNVFIGSGSGATAIAHVWPYVPAGNTLAVFQGRVWLNGLNTVSGQYNLLQWTGTGATYGNVGYDDFLSADASGSLILSDSDLVHAITALRSLNNYLFIMGDQSVKQIGNISVASEVTNFTILTLSSDQGTIYPKSCISFNRIFMFSNQQGIYGVFGSSVQKLSADMDGIFEGATFGQVVQGGVVDLNSIHYAVFLIVYKGSSYLMAFDGKRWFLMQQGTALAALVTVSAAATGLNVLYGSTTTDVTPLLANTSGAVNFILQTGETHHGNAAQGKRIVRAGFTATIGAASQTLTFSVDTEQQQGTLLTMNIPNVANRPQLVGGSQSNDSPQLPITNTGIYLGATLQGSLANLTISNVVIEYQEGTMWRGA